MQCVRLADVNLAYWLVFIGYAYVLRQIITLIDSRGYLCDTDVSSRTSSWSWASHWHQLRINSIGALVHSTHRPDTDFSMTPRVHKKVEAKWAILTSVDDVTLHVLSRAAHAVELGRAQRTHQASDVTLEKRLNTKIQWISQNNTCSNYCMIRITWTDQYSQH